MKAKKGHILKKRYWISLSYFIQWVKLFLFLFVSVCLFVCLGFSSYSRIFHSKDLTITGEGLHILTCARHSWPLSSEGSLPCFTYWDTGHPSIMVIFEDPWHWHRAFSSGAFTVNFLLTDQLPANNIIKKSKPHMTNCGI